MILDEYINWSWPCCRRRAFVWCCAVLRQRGDVVYIWDAAVHNYGFPGRKLHPFWGTDLSFHGGEFWQNILLIAWWRHQMETFSAFTLLALCAGNSPVTSEFRLYIYNTILLIEPLGINLQWHFIWNSYVFIKKNVFENIICKMESICVNWHFSHCQCIEAS